MSVKLINTIAVVVIALASALIVNGPEAYEDFAVLRCNGSSEIVATYDNMSICVNERRMIEGCQYPACQSPYKGWTAYYYQLLIPFCFSVIGLLFLRGSWWLRFSLLNAAIAAAGAIIMIYSANTVENYDAEGGFFFYIYLIQVLLTSSLIFAAFYWSFYCIKARLKNTPNKSLKNGTPESGAP